MYNFLFNVYLHKHRSVSTSSSRPRSQSSTSISGSSLTRPAQVKSLEMFPPQLRHNLGRKTPIVPSSFLPMTAEPGFLDRPDSDSDSMSGLIDGLNISGKIGGNNYGTVFCLKSQSFLHNAISDFHSRDVSDGELYDVVISGASVQCYINNEYDGFRITNNFTPSLICDRFPPRSYFWFNRRMHSRIKDGKDLKWWMHPTMIRISFRIANN